MFPFYNPLLHGEGDAKWMKRVYLYVGDNQRMTGECRKLGKPFAVVRRRQRGADEDVDDVRMEMGEVDGDNEQQEELEIVEVVRYKIVFSGRPEPVGGGTEEGA